MKGSTVLLLVLVVALVAAAGAAIVSKLGGSSGKDKSRNTISIGDFEVSYAEGGLVDSLLDRWGVTK